jgi:PEP-CTERM motif
VIEENSIRHVQPIRFAVVHGLIKTKHLRASVGSLDPTISSGSFSETMRFGVGDTIGFVSSSGGSTDQSSGFLVSFGPALDPVPEPSAVVALLGLCGMGLLGAVWACRRGRICLSQDMRRV